MCQRYGLDPGAIVQDDDLLAYQLRVSTLLAVAADEAQQVDPMAEGLERIAEARRTLGI